MHTSRKGNLSGTTTPRVNNSVCERKTEALGPRTEDQDLGPCRGLWAEERGLCKGLWAKDPQTSHPSKTKLPLVILMGWVKYTMGFTGIMEFDSSS